MQMNRILAYVFVLWLAGLPASAKSIYDVDWSKAKELRPGVRVVQGTVEVPRKKPLSPEELQKLRETSLKKATPKKFALNAGLIKADVRPMRITVMRIDLSLPGLSFTGLGRAPEHWGEPMPDAPEHPIGTLRTTALKFMDDCLGKGYDMIVTTNSGPWSPWPPPKGNLHANPAGITISDGVLVRDNGPWSQAMFLVYKDGRIEITNSLDMSKYKTLEEKYNDIWLCHTGFSIIMKNGQPTGQTTGGYSAGLMPRLTYGLDKEHHFLYIATIDGRQPGWSEGATGQELFELFTALGACDVIDFDGGGSATVCAWNKQRRTCEVYNMHDYNRKYYRPCGMLLGIYLKQPHE